MYLKGIKRKDVDFILVSMRWGKYDYEQKSIKYIHNPDGSYCKEYVENVRNPTLNQYNDVMNRLKEAINK